MSCSDGLCSMLGQMPYTCCHTLAAIHLLRDTHSTQLGFSAHAHYRQRKALPMWWIHPHHGAPRNRLMAGQSVPIGWVTLLPRDTSCPQSMLKTQNVPTRGPGGSSLGFPGTITLEITWTTGPLPSPQNSGRYTILIDPLKGPLRTSGSNPGYAGS